MVRENDPKFLAKRQKIEEIGSKRRERERG